MRSLISLGARIWREDEGFVASADLVLVTTVVVLGMLVGLVTLRDQVLQELGDVATAVGQLNQSYSVASFTTAGFSVAGSSFADQSDFCELGAAEGSNNNDAANEAPGCIEFTAASGEYGEACSNEAGPPASWTEVGREQARARATTGRGSSRGMMMIQMMRRLWREERGETSSMAVVLITTILAFGALTGLVTVRNQIVQEFGDFALAVENLNQSFTGPSGTFTDPGPFPTDTANNAPAGLDLQFGP